MNSILITLICSLVIQMLNLLYVTSIHTIKNPEYALNIQISPSPIPEKIYQDVSQNISLPEISPGGKKELIYKENTQYYPITGNTQEDLLEQLNTFGPEDYDGRYFANAQWAINWDYPYKQEGDRCILYKPIDVDVSVTYTLPEWTNSDTAPQDLIDKWNIYMEKLVIHEKGHKDIAYNNALLILDEFQNLHSFDTCDLFLQEMDRIGFAYIDKAHEEDKTYDTDTNHGATQGAIFP